MSLHGEIKVNHHVIGTWSAQRAGTTGQGDYVYRVKFEYTDMAGYTTNRTWFTRHKFSDGAVALTGQVMVEFGYYAMQPQHSEPVLWHEFCANHNLNPVSDLGSHITLKE